MIVRVLRANTKRGSGTHLKALSPAELLPTLSECAKQPSSPPRSIRRGVGLIKLACTGVNRSPERGERGVMSAFSSIALWWAIPVGATLVTMLWVWWAGRTRKPDDILGSTQRFDQFRRAMDRPPSTGKRGRALPPARGRQIDLRSQAEQDQHPRSGRTKATRRGFRSH